MLKPILERVSELHAAHPGHVVGLQIGDFLEFFGQDAVSVAKALKLTLTVRRTRSDGEEPITMCGFPYHVQDRYIDALKHHGIKVVTEVYRT